MKLPLSPTFLCVLSAIGHAQVEEPESNSDADDSNYGTIVYEPPGTSSQSNQTEEYTYGTVVYRPSDRRYPSGNHTGSFDTVRTLLQQQGNSTEANNTVAKRSINEDDQPSLYSEYPSVPLQNVRYTSRFNKNAPSNERQYPALETLDAAAREDFSTVKGDLSFEEQRTDKDLRLRPAAEPSAPFRSSDFTREDDGYVDLHVDAQERDMVKVHMNMKGAAFRNLFREFFQRYLMV